MRFFDFISLQEILNNLIQLKNFFIVIFFLKLTQSTFIGYLLFLGVEKYLSTYNLV